MSVGDPRRAEVLSKLLDDPKQVYVGLSSRGFTTYTGTKNNVSLHSRVLSFYYSQFCFTLLLGSCEYHCYWNGMSHLHVFDELQIISE